MEFRVVINIDRAARPTVTERARRFVRGEGAEARFWTAFRASRETETGLPKPEAPPPFAPEEAKTELQLSKSDAGIHQQLRNSLPGHIRRLLIDRLAPRLGVTPQAVYHRMIAPPVGPGEAPDDNVAALAALRIEIGEIRGGSLELLVIAFGFAKLATLAGISSEEFAGYLKIVTPLALNLLYGTSVPMVADATPTGDADAPDADNGTAAGMAAATGRGLLQQASPYVIPGILAGVLLWLTVSNFDAESARLADERKVLLDAVAKQQTALSTERTAIAQHLSEVAGKLLDATAQREVALQKANDNLAIRQTALLTALETAATNHDKVLLDFVKARFSPAPGPAPAPAPVPPIIACAPLMPDSVRALQQMLAAQHLYSDKVDGVFGSHSWAALAMFQRNAGLPATGLPDQPTMLRLGLVCQPVAR